MVPIETERLVVRNFTMADAEPLRQVVLQMQSSEYAVYDHKWPTSVDEIRGIVSWFASGDDFLAVCLRETGRFIGWVSLNRGGGEDTDEYDLGYCFDFDYHGKGYASEACAALMDRAFRLLGATAITSGTAAANLPSCRLLAKLGMRKTGEGTGSFWQNEAGEPIEFLGYSFAVTREQWMAAHPEGAA